MTQIFPAPGTAVGGYRLLRQVARSDGNITWLARSENDSTAETALLTIATTGDALTRRIDAHSRIRSSHVVELWDVATLADGRILLVTEATDWTLATLLASRASISAGEAVTILAPFVAGVAAIHAAGRVHGRLTAATIHFTSDGRPVIGGLESSRVDPVDRPRGDGGVRLSSGAEDDFRAIGAVLRAVSEVVNDATAQSALAEIATWLDPAGEHGSATALAMELECRIFAIAPALPVVLVADRHASALPGDVTSARTEASRGLTALWRAVATLPLTARRRRPLKSYGLGDFLRRVARGRALMIGVGVGVLVLVLCAGLWVIPPMGSSTTGETTRSTGSESSPPPATDTPTSTSTSTPSVGADEATALSTDDPVAATVALLAIRAQCVASASNKESTTTVCVSGYAERESAVDVMDRHTLTNGTDDRALLVSVGSRKTIELVQAHGDAVLLRAVPDTAKRQPVLVLVVRTDTGWRLRDLFEAD
ncbi:hypothetical protein IWX78_001124 [Mycetocola sp. CAN_C7]|uniref:hypothetical protein n=1 Tax=Mycetocola sp. CAN_C7 TaxID=2787724 RepID=UPI0018CBCB2F